MARRYNERRSLRTALETYLDARGWGSVRFEEGFLSNKTVTIPLVAVHFLPSAFSELELGRGDTKRDFIRRVQVDCYMNNEQTADAITDDIADFIDGAEIIVSEVGTGTELGYMFVPDTGSISIETVPPALLEPKVTHWRGVVKCTYEVFYD